jgi:hypothetical protein
MGSFSNAAEVLINDAVFGGQTLTIPGTWYLRLTTTTPSDASAGTEVTTSSWTDYAPLAVTNNLTNFPTGASKTNGTAFAWGAATVTGANVTIAGVEFWSASSGGTRWAWLAATGTVASGTVVSFAAGALTCSQD